jgi:hypothetical protein
MRFGLKWGRTSSYSEELSRSRAHETDEHVFINYRGERAQTIHAEKKTHQSNGTKRIVPKNTIGEMRGYAIEVQ